MEDSNSSGSSYWDSNDEDETNLPSPIDMTDLMKGQDDTEDSDEDDVIRMDIKEEKGSSNEPPTNICVIPGCRRLYVTNINENQPMIRLPPKRDQQSKDISRYLNIQVNGGRLELDDEYFICAKHFQEGVCSRLRGHPSYLPSIFPLGFEPKLTPPSWKLNTKLQEQFIEPIVHGIVKDEITYELLSDSEIDEPYATEASKRIPSNKNEKVDPKDMDKWTQLPTCGDILRSVFALLTLQEQTPPNTIASKVHAIWDRTHCCPMSIPVILQKVRELTQSSSGLRSTEILGSRKREFAKLFDVLAPVSNRDERFNAEFYVDQMTDRKMFMAPNGAILKPAAPPGQVKKAPKPLKDVGLPTWLQLPTMKQVHETLTKSPFSIRTLAKILRSLWKKAECQPCNLNYVCEKLIQLKKVSKPSEDLFDIAWETSLRNQLEFNDVFYEDQKGKRRMFLIPQDLPVKKSQSSQPVHTGRNKRIRASTEGVPEDVPAKKTKFEKLQKDKLRHLKRDPKKALLDQLGYPELQDGTLLKFARNFETDPKIRNSINLPNMPPLINRKCGFSEPLNLRSNLCDLAEFVVKSRKRSLLDSPLFSEATSVLYSEIDQVRAMPEKNSTLSIKPPHSGTLKNKSEVMSGLSEKQWHAKEVSLLRQKLKTAETELNLCRTILVESNALTMSEFPVHYISAQIAQLTERNRRYREIVNLYRNSFKLGHNKNRTIAVLHHRMKLYEEALMGFVSKPSLMEQLRTVQEEIHMASTVGECKRHIDELIQSIIHQEYLKCLPENSDIPWHEEDPLLDRIEDDLWDDFDGDRFAPGEFFDPSMLIYKCASCGLGHESTRKLLQHEKFFCTLGNMSICHVCHMRVPPAEIDAHVEEHASVYRLESELPCDICYKTMPNLKEMSNHAKQHNVDFLFCICCNKTFKSEESFSNHWWKRFEFKNRHGRASTPRNKKLSFLCSYCGVKFKTPADADTNALYDYHICKDVGQVLKDTGVTKSYLCTDCGAGFYGLVEFKKHLYDTLHTIPDGITLRKIPCHCLICNRKLSSKQKMGEHILIHTNIKPYQCPICGLKSNKNYTLRRHVLDAHKNASFKTQDAIVIPEELAKRNYLLADVPGRINDFLELKEEKQVTPAVIRRRKRERDRRAARNAAKRANGGFSPSTEEYSVIVPVVQAPLNTVSREITEVEEQTVATNHLQTVLNTKW